VSGAAFDELLRRLAAADIRFVLIGGLAVNAWGVVRATRDVDIVADPSAENMDCLAAVVVDAGGRVQTGEMLAGSAQSISSLLKSGERVMIDTDLGALDVVQGMTGVPPYDELRERATEVDIVGVTVPVCSLGDLRTMKRAAGRLRDLADLEDLEAANGEDEPA
jgi:predicted nucleotidyltransferase